ncbi:hypothetical protein GCM10011321_31760 [Youhaiella tibetensis]|uniref:DUF5131 family protein n=1 Tax=Paradevosia tibetensis TaxID=1447062 RepID=A0A5B9DJ61_9HYPH|nr:phage Gp37/Gp68 family protein [Youhaiella tibetensis]QEE18865.1 DUF5131 family protein [Youhaiella tibetensis]GGF38485.1 hypothetical protein GCM10011321_31760 [Youhaiella tibetensis]
MSDRTGIEWTEATWNPLRGCSRVSEGCRHCYAEGIAARFSAPGQPYDGLARLVTRPGGTSEARWAGKVVLAPESALKQPLRWTRPRLIFVNSMSDLFHEAVPDEWIDQVFAVMAAATCHTFQILTKRPERMRAYISSPATVDRILMRARELDPALWYLDWPMPNVWLGTSIEDQPTADTRIPYLRRTPAAVRFVSAEPLLAPVDLFAALGVSVHHHPANRQTTALNALVITAAGRALQESGGSRIHQVIVGGESGRRARPMHPAWARLLRDQCKAGGIAFFFKQWGEWTDADVAFDGAAPHPLNFADAGRLAEQLGVPFEHHSDGSTLVRVGKRKAGRLLDGVLHDAMPAPLNPQSASHERIWA